MIIFRLTFSFEFYGGKRRFPLLLRFCKILLNHSLPVVPVRHRGPANLNLRLCFTTVVRDLGFLGRLVLVRLLVAGCLKLVLPGGSRGSAHHIELGGLCGLPDIKSFKGDYT